MIQKGILVTSYIRFLYSCLPSTTAQVVTIFFDYLVDITKPICQKIDGHEASMTIFDTSGIEAFVYRK